MVRSQPGPGTARFQCTYARASGRVGATFGIAVYQSRCRSGFFGSGAVENSESMIGLSAETFFRSQS